MPPHIRLHISIIIGKMKEKSQFILIYTFCFQSTIAISDDSINFQLNKMLIHSSQTSRLITPTIISHTSLLQHAGRSNPKPKRWLWTYKATIESCGICSNRNVFQGQCQRRGYSKSVSLNQNHATLNFQK